LWPKPDHIPWPRSSETDEKPAGSLWSYIEKESIKLVIKKGKKHHHLPTISRLLRRVARTNQKWIKGRLDHE